MIQSVRFQPKYIPEVTNLVRKYLVPNLLKRIGIQSLDEVTEEILTLEPMVNPDVLLLDEVWHKSSLLYIEEDEKEGIEESIVGCSLGWYTNEDDYNAFQELINTNPKFRDPSLSESVKEFIDKSIEMDSVNLFRKYNIKNLLIYESGVMVPRLRGRGLNILQINEFAETFGNGQVDAMMITSMIPPEIYNSKNFSYDTTTLIKNCSEEIFCHEMICNGYLMKTRLAFF